MKRNMLFYLLTCKTTGAKRILVTDKTLHSRNYWAQLPTICNVLEELGYPRFESKAKARKFLKTLPIETRQRIGEISGSRKDILLISHKVEFLAAEQEPPKELAHCKVHNINYLYEWEVYEKIERSVPTKFRVYKHWVNTKVGTPLFMQMVRDGSFESNQKDHGYFGFTFPYETALLQELWAAQKIADNSQQLTNRMS